MYVRMPKCLTALAAVALIAISATSVQATNLPPGTTTGISFDTVSTLSVGSVQKDTGWMTFNTSSGLSGSVRELVVTDSSSSSKLDFVYQVKLNSSSTDSMGRLTGFNFGSSTIDAVQTATLKDQNGNQLLDTGTTAAATVDRSGSPGATVGFNFSPKLAGGQESYVLLVRTENTNSFDGTINLIDGSVLTFGGYATNPEPTSLALLGTCLFGLGGFGAVRRWRMGAQS